MERKKNLEEIHQPLSTDNSKFKARGHRCRDSDKKNGFHESSNVLYNHKLQNWEFATKWSVNI